MTLVVAIKAQDGIVLAGDSRGTIGDPRGLTAINDTQQKVHQLGNHGIAFAGSSETAAALLDEYRKRNLDSQTNVDELANEIAKVSADLFAQWFREIRAAERAGVILLIAGYRRPPGTSETEPLIYLLNSQANFAPGLAPETMMAGVPQYAVYLFHRYYDRNITLERARALAEYLIAETASQDPKVGGPIRIAEVTPGGYRQLTDSEVASVSAANAALNQNLRSFFLTGGTP
jgi:20S proteasome alpha/beta subunit